MANGGGGQLATVTWEGKKMRTGVVLVLVSVLGGGSVSVCVRVVGGGGLALAT